MAWVDVNINVNNGSDSSSEGNWVDAGQHTPYNPTIEEQFANGVQMTQPGTPQMFKQGESVESNGALESSALDPLEGALVGKLAEPVINGAIGLYHLPRKLIMGTDGKSANQISDLQALADKHGIPLTPATITGSPTLARTESNLNTGVTSKLGMSQAVDAEKSGIDDAIYKQFDRMGANGSNSNAGETFTKGVSEVLDMEKEYFKNGFEQLFAKYGDAPIFSIRGVKGEAQRLVDQAESIPLIKNSSAYRDSKAILESADDLTWADWSKLRTHLGALTQDTMATGKPSTAAFKNMYSKLEGDLQSSVARTGDIETLGKYKKLIDEYKKFKTDFDGRGSGARFINSLEKGTINPEAVGHMINNSTLKAKGALSAGGYDVKTGLPNAKKVSATDTLFSSKATNADEISLSKFIKYSDRDGFKEILKAPDADLQLQKALATEKNPLDGVIPTRAVNNFKITDDAVVIEDLQKIAREINNKNSYKNSSNTAIYNQLNWMKANPLSGAFMVAKDATLSLAYRSELFKRWLSKGAISKDTYQQLMKARTPKNFKKGVATNALFQTDTQTPKEKLGL